MTTRQKLIMVAIVLLGLFLGWQVVGMLSGGKSEVANNAKPTTAAMNQQRQAPQPVELARQKTTDAQTQMELMRLQQETEVKYLGALNELQMLKVAQQIAEANQAIMKAKLDTVTSQKDIVTLLSPAKSTVTQDTYAQGLANQAPPPPSPSSVVSSAAMPAQDQEAADYTVISVSQLQNKWGAVLGLQGKLYGVSIGDVLAADQSTVVAIDKSGVTLMEKSGNKKKISLIPII